VLLKELEAFKATAEGAAAANQAVQSRLSEAEQQLHRALAELEVREEACDDLCTHVGPVAQHHLPG
jgi:ABC-type transporter Mla subunit MlaD